MGDSEKNPNQTPEDRDRAVRILTLLHELGLIESWGTVWQSTHPIEIRVPGTFTYQGGKWIRMTVEDLLDIPGRGFRVWRRSNGQ